MRRAPNTVAADNLLAFVGDDYAKAIGRVITQWSFLEGMIEAACWQAARLRNDLGRSVTSQMQMQSKIDLLETLLSQTRPVLAEQFHRVADYIRNCLLGQRNLVAHGMWAGAYTSAQGAAHAVKFSAKGTLVDRGKPVTIDELNALARNIADVTVWVLTLGTLLPALRQRPGGLGHTTPAPPDPQVCATRKLQALQRPTLHRRALEARKRKEAELSRTSKKK